MGLGCGLPNAPNGPLMVVQIKPHGGSVYLRTSNGPAPRTSVAMTRTIQYCTSFIFAKLRSSLDNGFVWRVEAA
jgi:hypothetical protein